MAWHGMAWNAMEKAAWPLINKWVCGDDFTIILYGWLDCMAWALIAWRGVGNCAFGLIEGGKGLDINRWG